MMILGAGYNLWEENWPNQNRGFNEREKQLSKKRIAIAMLPWVKTVYIVFILYNRHQPRTTL